MLWLRKSQSNLPLGFTVTRLETDAEVIAYGDNSKFKITANALGG